MTLLLLTRAERLSSLIVQITDNIDNQLIVDVIYKCALFLLLQYIDFLYFPVMPLDKTDS